MVLIRSFQKDSSDKMPQTVPSAGFTPPDYSAFAADSFDLSLLPSSPESDIPLSPYTSPPSLFSSDSSSRILKPPQIYTTFYPNTPPLENQDDLLEENIKKTNIYSPYGTPFQNQNSTLLTILKEEPNSGQYLSPGFQHSAPISPPSSCVSYSNHSSPIYPQSVSPVNVQEGLEEFNIIQKSIQSGKYNQPLLSPVPQKSLDYIPNSFTTNSSNQSLYAGSPLTINIKHENTVDLQESLEEFKFLQKSLEDTYQSKQYQKYNDQYKDNYSYSPNNFQDNFSPQIHSPFQDQFALQLSPEYLQKVPEKLCLLEAKKENDHQLLREALRDTSFQEKYNLKPFEFGEIGTGFVGTIKMEEPDEAGRSNGGIEGHREDVLMTSCNEELDREKIEPVLSLAIAQMKKEADNICSVLGISPDPTRWSSENVKAWLTWTAGQLNLGPIHMDYFNIDGAALVALTEEQFIQRAPQCGSTLHARLEIWKAACSDENLGYSLQTVARTQTTTPAPVATVTTSGESSSSPAPPVVTPQIPTTWNAPGSSQSSNASSAGEASDDEDNESTAEVSTPSPVTTSPKATTSRGSTGSSHIHLWQFLKELLAAPTLYGSAIRWLDRGKGVFKIEDSVRVARLWGKRKNRPAMNYDKLSRSIRQYYKKGIMKKTERSQRLVYQFCHPYCL